ncbi:MAG: hypothetical protein COA50_12320 [Flavobacteriaceae bacterium]|nr:MAG: hypothetical protein COA50_12320 [Flavobacteriaceae bacterium]
MKRTTYFIWSVLLLFFVGFGNAQEYGRLSNDYRLALRLQSHVLINLDTVPLSKLKTLLDKRIPIAVNLSKNNNVNLSFLREYIQYNNQLVVLGDGNADSLDAKEITVIKVGDKDVETIDLSSLAITNDSLVRFNGLEELGRIDYRGKMDVSDSLIFNIWKRSGKLPNFIDADNSNLEEVQRSVSMLNAKKKAFGVVRTKERLLENVTFKNSKDGKANGYFSFPVPELGIQPILTPHKAGYHFSPDIIFITPENQDNIKQFIGVPLDPESGLSDYFVFESKVKNKTKKNDAGIITNGVLFERDNEIGAVGLFKDRAYIDTGIKSRSTLKSSFTITAWVKPTTRSSNNSILGKGDLFVLKIHEGFLTFTMAGIKDYISEPSPVPINEWTHIALVHSKVNNDLRFFIDGNQTDRVELIADYATSDYNLLIGSNLWEEFFVGYLGAIKIWERELNNNEIKLQFSKKSKEETALIGDFIWGLVILLIFLMLFFLARYFLGKRKNSLDRGKADFSQAIQFNVDDAVTSNKKEQLLCFGTLRILNEAGIDIAKKLSPMLKRLFIVVFLHSYGMKKGISTKKLTELLWPGMTVQSAKNTRGTSIQNLRTILVPISGINLVFEDKLWFLEIETRCYCDYHMALNYLNYFAKEDYSLTSLEKELPKFIAVLKEGRFLANSSEAWLDPYLEKFSNVVIEQCSQLSKKLNGDKHGDLLFNIAEVMYIYDDLNEKALQLKLQILIKQGKLSLAHSVYDNFTKLYHKLYKETYVISFEDMISEDHAPF